MTRLALLGPLLLSCDGDATRSGSSLVDLPVLQFNEVARIGGADAQGAGALGSVGAVAILPEADQLAVVDGTTQQIRIFRLDGTHARTIGRRGGGPGEFQALRNVAPRFDGGLCTWDIQQARVTQFDSLGSVTETGRADLHEVVAIRPSFSGFLPDCSFVLRDTRDEIGMRDLPEGLRRDTVRFLHYNGMGAALGLALQRVGAETWLRNRDGGWGRADPIFGTELTAFVAGNRLWVGVSGAFGWRRIHLRSGVTDSLHFDVPNRPASPTQIDAERLRRLEEVVVSRSSVPPTLVDGQDIQQRLADQRRDGIREAPARSFIPAYDRAVGGRDGTVWIRQFPEPDQTIATWVMISTDDQLHGRLALDRQAALEAVTQDWLVVSVLDEMDAVVLRVLRLTDGAQRPPDPTATNAAS